MTKSRQKPYPWVMMKSENTLRLVWAAGACSAMLFSSVAFAGVSSPWAESLHSTARLIGAGAARPEDHLPSGSLLAGLELRLDPKFITYWRSPGEAGVPPTFEFGGSENLKDVRVQYPAPEKLDEGGTEAFGYRGEVTFPLVVVALDPARPVKLELAFGYAVCADLCLPAKAHLDLVLDGSPSAESKIVFDALATVPKPRKLGEAGALRIDAFTPMSASSFQVDATTPDGTGILVVEAPEPWYFSAAAGRAEGNGHVSFTLTGPARVPAELPDGPVRLTLVGSTGAIEVPVRLDASAPKP